MRREPQSNVDKLIHSDQENLRPPQRSVVLFTVYAFNRLFLVRAQATDNGKKSTACTYSKRYTQGWILKKEIECW